MANQWRSFRIQFCFSLSVTWIYLFTLTMASSVANSPSRFRQHNGVEPAVGSFRRHGKECFNEDCQQEEPIKDIKALEKALKSAQEAKDAQVEQQNARAQAANQLADKAKQVAQTAEATLEGKDTMVKKLRYELKEAEAVCEEETNSYQVTQKNLQSALAATALASRVLKSLVSTIKTAEDNVATSKLIAEGEQHELAEKTALVEAARARVATLRKELEVAKQDLNYIKVAVSKAGVAARNAETADQRKLHHHLKNRHKKGSNVEKD